MPSIEVPSGAVAVNPVPSASRLTVFTEAGPLATGVAASSSLRPLNLTHVLPPHSVLVETVRHTDSSPASTTGRSPSRSLEQPQDPGVATTAGPGSIAASIQARVAAIEALSAGLSSTGSHGRASRTGLDPDASHADDLDDLPDLVSRPSTRRPDPTPSVGPPLALSLLPGKV